MSEILPKSGLGGNSISRPIEPEQAAKLFKILQKRATWVSGEEIFPRQPDLQVLPYEFGVSNNATGSKVSYENGEVVFMRGDRSTFEGDDLNQLVASHTRPHPDSLAS